MPQTARPAAPRKQKESFIDSVVRSTLANSPGGLVVLTGMEMAKMAAERKREAEAGARARPSQSAASTQRKPAQPARSTASRASANPLANAVIRTATSRNPVVKEIAGYGAQQLAMPLGVARGAVGTLEDMYFLSRLMNPLDLLVSPRGQSAYEELARGALRAGQYLAGSTLPEVVEDVKRNAHDFRVRNDRTATPTADTALGEAVRRFSIGVNNGELAWDVGTAVRGGALLKGLGVRKIMSPVEELATWKAKGVPGGIADSFVRRYEGVGHHSIFPQRFRLPPILGGGPLPKEIVDSEYNLVRPEGYSYGQFYLDHYGLDDFVHGGPIPREFGVRGWSGKKLGFKRYGPLERVVRGTPPALKEVIGAGATGGGTLGAEVVSGGPDASSDPLWTVGSYWPGAPVAEEPDWTGGLLFAFPPEVYDAEADRARRVRPPA